MSENLQKLIGVVVMAVLVVVGVAVSSGDDTNFTRNAAYIKFDGFRQLPEAQQARLAPAFLEQAAPKSLDTGPINKINNEVGPIAKGATGYKLKNVIVTSLEASVLEGRGVDGKGGKGLDIWTTGGTTRLVPADKAGIVSTGGVDALSGRKASFRAGNGMDGVADRIEKWGRGGTDSIAESVCKGKVVDSLKNVMVTSYTDSGRVTYYANDGAGGCPDGYTWKVEEGEALKVFPKVEMREAELLAECMDSKVGDVFLKSHIEASATDCIATVLPTALPDRAKQLGTYWQTPQQLICGLSSMLQKQQQTICESLMDNTSEINR